MSEAVTEAFLSAIFPCTQHMGFLHVSKVQFTECAIHCYDYPGESKWVANS